jgi:hypothetical protein
LANDGQCNKEQVNFNKEKKTKVETEDIRMLKVRCNSTGEEMVELNYRAEQPCVQLDWGRDSTGCLSDTC